MRVLEIVPDGGAMTILVLGLGNTLLTDDGVGIHVVHAVQRSNAAPSLICIDGGTIGLGLLPDVEAADALILVDAAEIGAAPGTIAVFEGDAMDTQLGGKKRTPHEVAAFDLIATATMLGSCPRRRALVGVQPASTEWGLEPTADVRAAIEAACASVLGLAARWRVEMVEERTLAVNADGGARP